MKDDEINIFPQFQSGNIRRTVSRIYWKDQPFTLCKSNNFKSRNKDKIPCLYWTRRDVSSYLFAVNFLSIFDIFHGPSAAAVQSHFIRPICCLNRTVPCILLISLTEYRCDAAHLGMIKLGDSVYSGLYLYMNKGKIQNHKSHFHTAVKISII